MVPGATIALTWVGALAMVVGVESIEVARLVRRPIRAYEMSQALL
jgi:hypothetical protein